MRLFSYLSKGQVRTARRVGELGLDLNYSAELFRKYHTNNEPSFDGLPVSLSELLLLGSEGMKFSNTVTNWLLSTFPVSQLKELENEAAFNIQEVTFLAPIPRPGKVICIAGNYPASNKIDKPEYPTVFLKPSGGVIGNQQEIVVPKLAESVAYEVELAVVIGKSGRNLIPKDALSVIAGYTISNDLGDQLLEKRTSQWTSGKMFDTFTPMGPVMITPDELGDTNNLAIFTKVNDQVVQKGNTSQMFFDVSQLISYLSTLTTLDPGDVVLTGSPKLMDGEPNPYVVIRPGDFVQVGIETIAALTNPVIAEKEVE
jgi:acylpyruvate hydrolase